MACKQSLKDIYGRKINNHTGIMYKKASMQMLSSGSLLSLKSSSVTVEIWGAKGATLTKTKATQRNRFTATEMGAFLPHYIFGIKGSNFNQEDITKQFLRLN